LTPGLPLFDRTMLPALTLKSVLANGDQSGVYITVDIGHQPAFSADEGFDEIAKSACTPMNISQIAHAQDRWGNLSVLHPKPTLRSDALVGR